MTREKVVCVIDDDEAARDSLAFLLETDGFVVEAYDSAVAFINAGPPTRGSCIVTDVRMPGMDGIAMLRKLRELNDNRPVIVVTGHADIPLAIEAIGSGAFDFIEKPFEAEVLLGLVPAALDPQLGNSMTELTKKTWRIRLRHCPIVNVRCSNGLRWVIRMRPLREIWPSRKEASRFIVPTS